MKKFFAFFLSIAMMVSVFGNVGYASEISSSPLRLSVDTYSESVKSLAVQHLADMKVNLSNNPEVFGFSALELGSLEIGNPFSIYVFNDDSQLLATDTIAFPLLYLENIVGVMEVTYDANSNSYSFSFGTSYGNELNSLRNQSSYSDDGGLVIARMGDKLFATNGEDVTILLDKTIEGTSTVTVDQIETFASNITSEASSVYLEATDSIGGTTVDIIATPPSARALPNPLPVPHVKQTAVCGVAAWAAVLNYRFSTSYTNSTLATAMQKAGYISTVDEAPDMYDYRDFANKTHTAGCVFLSSPPAFDTMRTAINAGKPIMGSWYSGSGTDKAWHAVIITGYKQNTSSHTYYVKNPWYEDAQTITVTSSSSVVYSDAGYTWNLSQSVY